MLHFAACTWRPKTALHHALQIAAHGAGANMNHTQICNQQDHTNPNKSTINDPKNFTSQSK
jgi:hypothetical protein